MSDDKNPNMPTKTGWLIIILAFIMLIWELYVIILKPELKTISEEFWDMNDRTVIVAYAVGLLSGHFFWPRRK